MTFCSHFLLHNMPQYVFLPSKTIWSKSERGSYPQVSSTKSSVASQLGDACILLSLHSFCSFPVLMTQPYFWSWTYSPVTSLVWFIDNNRYESLLLILLNNSEMVIWCFFSDKANYSLFVFVFFNGQLLNCIPISHVDRGNHLLIYWPLEHTFFSSKL